MRIFLPLSLSTYLFRNEYLLNIKKKIFFSRMSTQSSTWAKMPKKPVLWKLCQLWCNILFFFGSFLTQHFDLEQNNFYSTIALCGLLTRTKYSTKPVCQWVLGWADWLVGCAISSHCHSSTSHQAGNDELRCTLCICTICTPSTIGHIGPLLPLSKRCKPIQPPPQWSTKGEWHAPRGEGSAG